MSLLIRYTHIPFYFRFSFTFPTSPIHPYAPPLRRDRACARTTIALALSDRSCLFDGHMTYDSHVFTSILSVSNMPPPAVMSLLIRYAHIPFYFRFSFTFPTLPIHPYTPPLQRDHTRSCLHDNRTRSIGPISLI